jgi:hypothetical protein
VYLVIPAEADCRGAWRAPQLGDHRSPLPSLDSRLPGMIQRDAGLPPHVLVAYNMAVLPVIPAEAGIQILDPGSSPG